AAAILQSAVDLHQCVAGHEHRARGPATFADDHAAECAKGAALGREIALRARLRGDVHLPSTLKVAVGNEQAAVAKESDVDVGRGKQAAGHPDDASGGETVSDVKNRGDD